MFCRNCGQNVPDTAASCAHCGTSVAPAAAAGRTGTSTQLAKNIKEEVQARTKDAWRGIKLFIVSPVGGLPTSYELFDPARALSIGVVFAVMFEVMFFFGAYRVADKASGAFGVGLPVGELNAKQILELAFAGLVPFLTLAAAGAIARKIFRGKGTLAGDVYTAGASLLPMGLVVLLSSIVGPANIEVIVVLLTFAITYQILMLYAGCSRIAGIPEAGAAPAVPVMLLLSVWLTKVVVVSMFS